MTSGRGVSREPEFADIRLGDLIGLPPDALVERFGTPSARRSAAGGVWLVFALPRLTLRVRCAGQGQPRAATWTASFADGFLRLSDAARAVGLWPAATPDVEAASVEEPLVRRALRCADDGPLCSLTATVRDGRFTQLSVFDEPPDWL